MRNLGPAGGCRKKRLLLACWSGYNRRGTGLRCARAWLNLQHGDGMMQAGPAAGSRGAISLPRLQLWGPPLPLLIAIFTPGIQRGDPGRRAVSWRARIAALLVGTTCVPSTAWHGSTNGLIGERGVRHGVTTWISCCCLTLRVTHPVFARCCWISRAATTRTKALSTCPGHCSGGWILQLTARCLGNYIHANEK